MLGIGMQEILIILVVALIVIGPKRLPELAKTLGKGFAEFRKAADDLQETVRMDLQKEKHEEFRQKYPDMVPDEDEDELMQEVDGSSEEKVDEAAKAADVSTAAGETIVDDPADRPEPSSAEASAAQETMADKSEDKPEPSYNPEEIEGGDDTEDDTRDA